MRYKSAEAFRAALEARLNQASGGDQDLSRRRRTVAFDRFLARLATAKHDGWLLKGGAALEFRMPERARSTKDIDLALFGATDAVDVLLDDLAEDPFGDHFSFMATRRKELSVDADRGPVSRLSMNALVGGRLFERFVVDLVTATAGSTKASDQIQIGHLLSFAELPVVELAVINLRMHWAEKLSAYLRRYRDRKNTRVKDLVDLVLLIEHGLTPDQELVEAVQETFTTRRQSLPTGELPSMASEWTEAFADMASDLSLSTQRADHAHARVEAFWRTACNSATNTPLT